MIALSVRIRMLLAERGVTLPGEQQSRVLQLVDAAEGSEQVGTSDPMLSAMNAVLMSDIIDEVTAIFGVRP